jgi:O-antigen/teichoic acid export membrane protein
MALRLVRAYQDKTSKKEIMAALGFLAIIFFALFVFIILLYFFFPDLNPLLALGVHLGFVIIVYLLVLIWGSMDRVREIFQKWHSFARAHVFAI